MGGRAKRSILWFREPLLPGHAPCQRPPNRSLKTVPGSLGSEAADFRKLRWITSRGSVEEGSILDVAAPLGSTTGVSSCDDPELAAGSASRSIQAGQGDDEPFVIEADGSELRRSHVTRELAIR